MISGRVPRFAVRVPILGIRGPVGAFVPVPCPPSELSIRLESARNCRLIFELIRRFGVEVHAFDPTPQSIEWVRTQALPKQLVFHEYGVADFNGSCEFVPPENPAHISYTMMQRKTLRPTISLSVRRMVTIMQSLGHERISLLKMDIEGAEYDVLTDLISSGIRVDQLLVEFHHRWPEIGIEKTKKAIRELNQAGYLIFNVSSTGEEYSFRRVDSD